MQREIIEYASTDESAPPIDRNTLVHILLSITSEQNGSDEFAGDVPTPAEIAKLEREIPKMGMEEMLEYAEKLIPDEVASNLFNMPTKYEMLLSNTYDLWFAPWAEKSKTTGLGDTPAEAFQIGTGVELLDLIRLGHRIVKRSIDEHQVRFTRDELIADGVLKPRSTTSSNTCRCRWIVPGRAEGRPGSRRHCAPTVHLHAVPVHHGRRQHARHDPPPVGDGASLWRDVVPRSMVQPQGQSNGLGDRFKNAMNDAFEVFVGGILHRTAAKGTGIQKIVDEAEMQVAWKEQKNKTPSVCDWMMLGEGHCVVIDATNHAVKDEAAAGLATFDEYAADIDKIFIEGKFEQLLSTIDLAKKHGGWDSEVVDGDTNFVPLVVIPDTGVPTGIFTHFDIIERGRKMFEHLQPHVYPAGLITVSDVQLLEGMADFAKKLPTGASR